ncbi:hypothetical protein SAMN05519103_06067 [Rhizobiales bacterium GAS113]|nr:hypothetical protein SAMN05519103_06067 [Rhizobiales bacterium GAS113]
MRIFAVATILALAAPASAHDFWANGRRVDPVTKNLCCSGSDTKELDPSLVKLERGGFRLADTNEFIPFERVQPSPDNAIWVSRWGGQSKCFFYPSGF